MSEPTQLVGESGQTKPLPTPLPAIGRIVHYRLTQWQADEINARRADAIEKAAWHSAIKSGAVVHRGNRVEAGMVFPAMIVHCWGDQQKPLETDSCNIQVFLDGNDIYWATSVHWGNKPGDFMWPTRG